MAENYFGITDTGRQRQNNEDAFIAEPVLKDAYIAACVIDGVGGYEGGEIAAAIARKSILDYFSVASGPILTMMQETLLSANEKIVQEKRQTGANEQMACVLTLAIIEKGANKFYYAHVGDTRLYLFRDGSLVKITKDHSFVGFLEDSGRLTEAAAMTHPKRNEINKALGFESPVPNPADFIETGESPFLPGDMLLLCSDGLTDMIESQKIISILSSKKSLKEKGQTLIEAANAAGGKDNITVVLVQNDRSPVQQKATKPVLIKKNESADKAVGKRPEIAKPIEKGQGHKANRTLLFSLILLTLLSLGGFIWQWLKKSKAENEVQPVLAAVRENAQILQDTLRTSGRVLVLSKEVFSDTIRIQSPLVISGDSIHIKGTGSTLFLADSSSYAGVIQILPSVKYVLLDSLALQNIILRVGSANRSALHFRSVRFQNSGVALDSATQFRDSLFSGAWTSFQAPHDSLKKRLQ